MLVSAVAYGIDPNILEVIEGRGEVSVGRQIATGFAFLAAMFGLLVLVGRRVYGLPLVF